MSTVINVQCVDQTLTVTNSPLIASGGINEDIMIFEFCSLWEGYAKTAVFYIDSQNVYHVVLNSDNSVTIPSEVLEKEGKFYFGVFGVKDTVTRTSQIVSYTVHQGAITSGTAPSDPTPDIYAQLLASYNEMLTDFNNAAYMTYVDGESIDPTAPIINDSGVSASTTWSSSRIAERLATIPKTNHPLWEGNVTVTNETKTISVPGIMNYSLLLINNELYVRNGHTVKRQYTEYGADQNFCGWYNASFTITGDDDSKLTIVAVNNSTASVGGVSFEVKSDGTITSAANYKNTLTFMSIVGIV